MSRVSGSLSLDLKALGAMRASTPAAAMSLSLEWRIKNLTFTFSSPCLKLSYNTKGQVYLE